MHATPRGSSTASALRSYQKGRGSQAGDASYDAQAYDTVYLLDEDPFVRQEISECLTALELNVVEFDSAMDCLSQIERGSVACLIVDLHIADLCGVEWRRWLETKAHAPVIFIADKCDIEIAVNAIKAGAMDLLVKPVNLQALAESVKAACERCRRQAEQATRLVELQARYSLLTPREREVLPFVVGGLLNKQASALLGISEVTFQIHRSHVLRKMQAGSVAELVRMAIELRIPHWRKAGK